MKARERRTRVQMIFVHFDKLTPAGQAATIEALKAAVTAREAQRTLFEEFGKDVGEQ